jgi:1-acyl-sn-glycerol-3-phosphate acyltransferase
VFYYFIKYLVFFLCKIFYRLKVYGLEHYPEGGAILAANHVSYLDPPIVAISAPGKINFLARGSLFNFRPFAWLIRNLQTHPVVKGRENLSTIKLTVDIIQKGGKVIIFPEGTRSLDGEIHPGQPGIGMLVQRTEALVVPIYIHGSYEIWGKNQKFPKPWGKLICVFGTPLKFSTIEGESKKEAQAKIVMEIMDAIKGLKAWYLNGANGCPP